jgi:subfamily B ATP-binding cassette protein MsbA
VSITAQRAITNMRVDIEHHVLRLPVSYFDSAKTGQLISRIMTDAEGIRNLVGTGIVQLVGGLFSALLAMGVLLYLNWRLTLFTVVMLAAFGSMMAVAFKRLRPIFRERSVINAEVTGRLGESLGGVRIVKVYTAEEREDATFKTGAERLFNNVKRTITGTSAVGSGAQLIVGMIGMLIMIMGGRAYLAGQMTMGGLITYVLFIGMVAAPLVGIASIGTQITEAFAGLDRIRELRDVAREDANDADRKHVPDVNGDVVFRGRLVRIRGGCAGASERFVPCRAGVDNRARRLERCGEEHGHRTRDGVPSARRRVACWSTVTTWPRFGSGTIAPTWAR